MATKISFLKDVKFKNATLFSGLPGIGLVGKICVDYLLKQLKAERVAYIYSDSFPPSVHTKEGVVELIRDELWFFGHKEGDFLFLAGPVQPALDSRMGMSSEHYEFARSIVEALKPKGLSRVCTLAGINIGEKRMGKEPKIVVAGSDKKTIEDWKALGAVGCQPEGLISGAAGLIFGIAVEAGIPGVCLMGETNANLVYGDQGSAKALLQLLIKRFGFSVDMGDIKKEAKKIEDAFKDLEKKFQDNQPEDDSELSYVR